MPLFGRLLGRRQGDPYAEGVANYEAGRYADAIEALRSAARRQGDSPAGSLASFHLRQALVAEGRRLLEVGQPAAAVPLLSEAVGEWGTFPDLHFLLGAAYGLAGRWSDALGSAQAALRLNPDYCEARLLEACSLQRLARLRESAASLDKLVESGRRVHNPLVVALGKPGGHHPEDLPDDLEARLGRLIVEGFGRDEVAAAVALCRAGHWDEGIGRFRELAERNPRYPDLQVKLAGALYQVGRNEEAQGAADRALALHPQYRSAALLKALIAADLGRIEEAWQIIAGQAPGPGGDDPRRHEALFGAYLRGVLALLTGRLTEVESELGGWSDLEHVFPRAVLLGAAAADLQGRSAEAERSLARLARTWPAEPDYIYFHCCQLLQQADWDRLRQTLSRWPAGPDRKPDDRPLHLSACMALANRRLPDLPPEAERPAAPSWQFLRAWSLSIQGRLPDCWRQACALWENGARTEPLAGLLVQAAVELGVQDGPAADWRAPLVLPDDLVPAATARYHRSSRSTEAELLIADRHLLHPEILRWSWLSTSFWLDPVRRWIG